MLSITLYTYYYTIMQLNKNDYIKLLHMCVYYCSYCNGREFYFIELLCLFIKDIFYYNTLLKTLIYL